MIGLGSGLGLGFSVELGLELGVSKYTCTIRRGIKSGSIIVKFYT